MEFNDQANINIEAIIQLSKDKVRPAAEIIATESSIETVKSKKMRLVANNNDSILESNAINSESNVTNSNGYLIIDATQITEVTSTSKSSQPLPSLPTIPATSILDPPTRCLDRGITIAMKTGDFNEVAAALILGANANYQQRSGELRTALVFKTVVISH